MKKDQQKPKASKAQKGCLIFVIIAGVIFLISLIASNGNSPEPVTKAEWDTMSYENKEAWIKSVLKNNGDNITNASFQIAQSVKSYFKYPEEVKFELGSLPNLSKGNIVAADSGMVYLTGFGTAKNGFGVKSRFAYSVMTVIRPDTMYIYHINISKTK